MQLMLCLLTNQGPVLAPVSFASIAAAAAARAASRGSAPLRVATSTAAPQPGRMAAADLAEELKVCLLIVSEDIDISPAHAQHGASCGSHWQSSRSMFLQLVRFGCISSLLDAKDADLTPAAPPFAARLRGYEVIKVINGHPGC